MQAMARPKRSVVCRDRLESLCDAVDVDVDVLECRRLALDLLGDAGADADGLERVVDRYDRVEHWDEPHLVEYVYAQGVRESSS